MVKIRFAILALLANAVFICPLKAESNSALNNEIASLKERLAKLEGQLSASPTSAEGAAESFPIKSAVDGIQVSGFVDSIYSFNFNRPSNSKNVARVFDNDSNSLNLNAAKISVAKATSAENPVGFRIDVLAGSDAKLIHSAGLGEGSDSFDLEQAFVQANLGTSKWFSGMNDVDLKVGKFVTLSGAEVIESKDNWNSSRGLLFGYAIPFTHTGARATYAFDNGWDLALGVNNGWDSTEDSNEGKTVEAHLGFNNIALPAESSMTVALQGYFGRESSLGGGGQRSLGDLVVTYHTPWKPLTLIYNFDYAHQEDGLESGENAKWYGHAGYVRWDLSDDWSLAGRGEYFEDSDGLRIAGTPATYREFTGTLEYRPWQGLITRLEFRNDHADEEVFADDSGTSKSQNTVGGEIIYSF